MTSKTSVKKKCQYIRACSLEFSQNFEEYSSEALVEILNEIDGTSAQLRELVEK